MSTEHKAFALDWNTFQRHLAPILRDALSSHSVAGLAAFIEHHRQSRTDPYEGKPLSGNSWLALPDSFPAARALLGERFGAEDKPFDPGRLGSYFQTPDAVSKSLCDVSTDDRVEQKYSAEQKNVGDFATCVLERASISAGVASRKVCADRTTRCVPR